MFIVLEGSDGTGKSTLVTQLADRIGGVVYKTPPKKYRKYSDKLHRDAPVAQHYQFYRDAVLDASNEIEELLASGKRVVCDRYWMTTVAYHVVMGAVVDPHDFKNIVMPDFTVLLVTDPDTQIERILERGIDSGDRRVLDRLLDLSCELFKSLIVYKQPFIAIDTGHVSVQECVDLVVPYVVK